MISDMILYVYVYSLKGKSLAFTGQKYQQFSGQKKCLPCDKYIEDFTYPSHYLILDNQKDENNQPCYY